MSLKLVETSLDQVSPQLRNHYIKRPNGSYSLNVSDLDAHVAPLKSALTKLKLENALKNADVRPNHVDLLLRRLSDRVAIDTKDGESTVRILPAASGTLSALDGKPDGASTLEGLVAATAREFPFLFGKTGPTDQTEAKVLTRSEFDKLGPRERAAKMGEGYRLVDEISEPKPSPQIEGKVLSRATFNALSPRERAAKMAEGYTLVD